MSGWYPGKFLGRERGRTERQEPWEEDPLAPYITTAINDLMDANANLVVAIDLAGKAGEEDRRHVLEAVQQQVKGTAKLLEAWYPGK